MEACLTFKERSRGKILGYISNNADGDTDRRGNPPGSLVVAGYCFTSGNPDPNAPKTQFAFWDTFASAGAVTTRSMAVYPTAPAWQPDSSGGWAWGNDGLSPPQETWLAGSSTGATTPFISIPFPGPTPLVPINPNNIDIDFCFTFGNQPGDTTTKSDLKVICRRDSTSTGQEMIVELFNDYDHDHDHFLNTLRYFTVYVPSVPTPTIFDSEDIMAIKDPTLRGSSANDQKASRLAAYADDGHKIVYELHIQVVGTSNSPGASDAAGRIRVWVRDYERDQPSGVNEQGHLWIPVIELPKWGVPAQPELAPLSGQDSIGLNVVSGSFSFMDFKADFLQVGNSQGGTLR